MNTAAERRIARALSLAIEQPTLAGGDARPFIQLHTILRELFPRLFAAVTVEVVEERALLLHLPGGVDAQPLLFLSHLDVAPIRNPDAWKHPPFSGKVEDGFVYGRGALDMKGHLIALLTAAESLLETGWQAAGDIYFAFSCDEEIRGNSMQVLCQRLRSRGVMPAFVLDEGGSVTKLPGLCTQDAALVGVAEKGRVCFTLTLEGEQNAKTLLRAAARLTRLRFRPYICDTTHQMLAALSPQMTGFRRFATAHLSLFKRTLLRDLDHSVYGRALTRTQLAISQLRGDALRGERPAITFQASILPGESAEMLIRRVEKTLRDGRISVSLDIVDEPSLTSPTQGVAWEALRTAIQVHFPRTSMAPYLLTGGSDARRMEPLCPYIYRFSPFQLPPDELQRVHGVDERISIDNLLRGTAFFKQMLQV